MGANVYVNKSEGGGEGAAPLAVTHATEYTAAPATAPGTTQAPTAGEPISQDVVLSVVTLGEGTVHDSHTVRQ